MLEKVVASLPAVFREAPIDCGLILGSGWGEVLETEIIHARIPYAALEGFGASTVQGHHGELLLLTISGKRVLVFSGRRHYYEGCTMAQVTYPVELMRCLGIPVVLITNAAGGINPTFHAGGFMVISDHINFTGHHPLRGEHHPEWGVRFPDCTHVYDVELSEKLAQLTSPALPSGVYAFTVGPSYETPAEIRAWRILGADAIGMSTVPEAILAHAAGLRVVGLSCITNMAAGISEGKLNHEEVLQHTLASKPMMKELIFKFLKLL